MVWIAIGVLAGVVLFVVIRAAKSVRSFFTNLKQESSQLYQHLDRILHRVGQMSFISQLFNRKKSKKNN